MEYAEHRFTLNLHSALSHTSLAIKKGDTKHRLIISLAEGGEPYAIADGCMAVFLALKPDNTTIFDSCSIEDNRVIYDVSPQTVAAGGMVMCEVRIYGPEQGLLSSESFVILVDDSGDRYEEGIPSTDEFNALTETLSKAVEIFEAWEKLKDNEILMNFADALDVYAHQGDGVGLPLIHEGSSERFSMMTVIGPGNSIPSGNINVPCVEKVQELIKEEAGYIDVTAAYEAALAGREVSCAKEYLWTLGAGRWALTEKNRDSTISGRMYLQTLAGEDKGAGSITSRILYSMYDFLFVEIYAGESNYYDAPHLHFEGDGPELSLDGKSLLPPDGLTLLDGKLYLSKDGKATGAGVELPEGSGAVDLSGYVQSVNGQAPDEKGNVEIYISEGGGGSQEYEETTRLDIRHLIEKGCFLLSSTGLPSNKTAAMVDAGYAMIAVSPGERYQVTTYIPTSGGIIFYAEDSTVVSVDEGGKVGGNVRVKDYEVTVPEGCTTMGVSTRKRTSDPITVKRVQVKSMTPQDIGDALAEQDRICTESEINEDDRMYSLENGLSFSFSGLDKGKIIFMTDGTRPILSDVYSIFKNHGMVLSVAPVYSGVVTYPEAMNDGSTALEFLHTVEDDGGEIYAHSMNADAITADTAEEMLRESKRWLTEEGFNVHGWIAPRGVFCHEARKMYAKYYRYGYRASDRTDSPLNIERPYLSELGLDGAKSAVDACEANKTVIVLFHHWSDNELEGFSVEDLEALLAYIETKNVDVTTYRDCFFNYGSFGNDEGNSSGGNGIEVSGAEVGQILKVAEVDKNGVPTAWETAEMPAGGGEVWDILLNVTTEEDVVSVGTTTPPEGHTFDEYEELMFFLFLAPNSGGFTTAVKIGLKANKGAWGYPIATFTIGGKTSGTGRMALEHLRKTNFGWILASRQASYNDGSINNNLVPQNSTTGGFELNYKANTVPEDMTTILPNYPVTKIEYAGYQAVIGAGSKAFVIGKRKV